MLFMPIVNALLSIVYVGIYAAIQRSPGWIAILGFVLWLAPAGVLSTQENLNWPGDHAYPRSSGAIVRYAWLNKELGHEASDAGRSVA